MSLEDKKVLSRTQAIMERVVDHVSACVRP